MTQRGSPSSTGSPGFGTYSSSRTLPSTAAENARSCTSYARRVTPGGLSVSGGTEVIPVINAHIAAALAAALWLTAPIALGYGVDPIHLGIIFLANLEIGYSTPPVGINLFIASQRFGKTIVTLFKSTLPYLLIMFIWLLMITYIPELSLWWKE